MTFKLTILGSSSALPTAKRFPAAHLLNVNERFFLIDCGEGTQVQLRKYKLGFSKINQIFVSHNHGDHVFGLPGLLSTMHLLGRKSGLQIYGPEGLRKYLDLFHESYGSEIDYKIEFIPVGHRNKSLIYEDKKIEVYSIPLKHRIPATGFLFIEKEAELNLKKEALDKYKPGIEQIAGIKKGKDLQISNNTIISNKDLTKPPYKRRSYAYISDTAYSEKISEQIKDVDLLFHEATFAEKDKGLAKKTFHSTASQAAIIAKKAGAGKLLIGHFSSRYKDLNLLLEEAKVHFDKVVLVEDGENFEILRERQGESPDISE